MTDTDQLIARLEEATEGSRETDAAIEVTKRALDARDAGLTPEQAAQWRHLGDGWVGDYHTKYMAPRYSTSIDAALTLVPEGSYLRTQSSRDRQTNWAWVEMAKNESVAISKTLALAVVTAALKARSSNVER